MTRVRLRGLAIAIGVSALSVVLFAASALAAGTPGTGMGSGNWEGGTYPTPGGPTAAGNTAPLPGAMMGNGSVPMGQGGGYVVSPSFTMGFGSMASMMGGIAGQPIEDEWHGANGDGLQRTTTGMMVWRKTDNWTAFTNGYMTWVNGPYGLQMRPNTERFPWEVQ